MTIAEFTVDFEVDDSGTQQEVISRVLQGVAARVEDGEIWGDIHNSSDRKVGRFTFSPYAKKGRG